MDPASPDSAQTQLREVVRMAALNAKARRESSGHASSPSPSVQQQQLPLQSPSPALPQPQAQMQASSVSRSNSAASSTVNNNPAEIALSLLASSSQALRKVVAESVGMAVAPPTLLSDADLNANESGEDDGHHHPTQSTPKLSRQDVALLSRLGAESSNPILRAEICGWLAQHSNLLPSGDLTLAKSLDRVTALLSTALEEENEGCVIFCLNVGRAICAEGDLWTKRMIDKGWDDILASILVLGEMRLPVVIACLHVCQALGQTNSTAKFMKGCMRCIQNFREDSVVHDLVCATLARNHGPIDDVATLKFFFEEAKTAAEGGEFKVACNALRVVLPQTRDQAGLVADMFEECDVLHTLTALYRSKMYGSKLEVATFLEALVAALDEEQKVLVCESGVIVRLVRLASPSSESATEDDGTSLAFGPAIRALTELAKVRRIGARIILAGGLGPLFSHANSNRNTRADAKQALKTLGVTNLGVMVNAWIEAATRMSDEDEAQQQPLEGIQLWDGQKLLVPQPPPEFFTRTVHDPNAVLGRGAFSTVYLAKLDTGRAVAVKRLTRAAAQDPAFADEIRVLARVKPHPNIVGILSVFVNDTECLIISELGGPTLSSVLGKNPNLSWSAKLRILLGIADGMKHLHSMEPCVLHLDLKASNVLLVGEDLLPKLCDFGLAVEVKKGFEYLLPGAHGTIQYMSPECLRDDDVELAKGFDTGADVYSFAMVMYEVAHPGSIPWQLDTFNTTQDDDINVCIRHAVLEGQRPTVANPGALPPGYVTLMKNCWDHHPANRLRFVGNFLEEESSERGVSGAGKTTTTTAAVGSQRSLLKGTIGGHLRQILWVSVHGPAWR